MCHRIYRWSGNLGGCWLHLRWWYDLGCVVSFFAVEEVLKRWSTPGNKRYLYKSPLWSSQIILMHAKNQAFAAQRADLKSKLQSLEDFKADLTRNFMLWAPFQNGIYLQPIWVRFNYVQGGVSMGPQLKKTFWPIASWICGTRSLPQSAHPSPLRINAKFYSKTLRNLDGQVYP